MKAIARLMALILCVGISACAVQPSPKQKIQAELNHEILRFYEAVQAQDADTIYAMLSPFYVAQFQHKDAFKAYFLEHYGLFWEMALTLREDPSPFQVHAQPEADPCGTFKVVLDDDGTWRIDATSEYPADLERQKMHLYRLLQSNEFARALQMYGDKHPELDGKKQRDLVRALKLESAPEILFWGNQARVDVSQNVRLIMTCTDQAWRLDQCILTP